VVFLAVGGASKLALRNWHESAVPTEE